MNINDIICVQPKGFVMMPTEEELKDPWVARLYLKNPSVVPNLPNITPAPRPRFDTNSEWREFEKRFEERLPPLKKSWCLLKRDRRRQTNSSEGL